ncbi:hypothetical protein KJ633_08895 [bacterium]|nr:hypothetical protein [bacterium]MBU3956562.1 hypothetical protein [bacterium]MBU4134335.1 hypothetical protein [bacterium]
MEKKRVETLLRIFNENKVDYILIGAFSFVAHGYARYTMDVDIMIKPTLENAKRCYKALETFGYDLQGEDTSLLMNKKVLFRDYSLLVDIHPSAAGVTFEEVWKNKKLDKVGDTPAYFASLDDIIKMKKAAGRPKDILDLENLTRLKKEKKHGKEL